MEIAFYIMLGFVCLYTIYLVWDFGNANGFTNGVRATTEHFVDKYNDYAFIPNSEFIRLFGMTIEEFRAMYSEEKPDKPPKPDLRVIKKDDS